MDGLFAAQAGWRTVAVLLARMPDDKARQEADALQNIRGLRSAERVPAGWMADHPPAPSPDDGADADLSPARAIAAAARRQTAK